MNALLNIIFYGIKWHSRYFYKRGNLYMIKVYIVLFSILISSSALFSQTQSFEVGEHIVYDVIVQVPELNINGKVGTLESKVISITNMYGSPCYHIRAVVYGDSWLNSIYQLKDTFETWVDTNTFETKKIMKFAREGTWTNVETSIFTNSRGYYYKDYKRHPEGKFIEVSQLAFDALSLVYYMRFVDKSKKNFTINWLEANNVTPDINFSISEGTSIKSALSLFKVETYLIRETGKYGTQAYISKKNNQVPIDVTIAEINISGYTLRVRGILRKYTEK